MEFTNPGQRLLDILLIARGRASDDTTGWVWVEALGGKRGDERELLIRLAELRHLVDHTENSIRAIEGLNQNLYLRWLSSVSQAISPLRLNNNWTETRRSLEDTTIQALEFAANELARRHQERVIPGDQLEALLTDLNKVVDSVIRSALEAPLKELLVRELERLRRAILNYRIRGADALREALEHAVGVVVLNKDALARNADEGELKGFWRVMYGVLQSLNFAMDVQQLSETVMKLLPPGVV
ncbi:MAG: hypothetical protein M3Q69_21580 [Acidobacteriota bacterium]|nr:hypothetical protein [Acidobacteriota bacterium]